MGKGVNCEKEMREKNEMGEGGCVCVVGEKKKEKQRGTWVVGEKKKERQEGTWVVGIKKKKEIKRKKEMGSGVYVYGGKKGRVEKKEQKKFERGKTKLVLFVCLLCLVQSVEL